jgi:UDP-N-acetylmuramoylalanine--D-glutamate ligase
VITSPAFRGKRYAVLGLARSGAATVRALVASGAKVEGWDDNHDARQSLLEQLKQDRSELGIEPGYVEKNWMLARDLSDFEAIIVSPGVPINRHPVAEKAARYGLPLIGDIELFAQARASLPPHKVVGITGTNGKSTTTALVHHILQTAGVPSEMGGNIGLPILAQDPLPEGGVYVLELSSYQIDLTFSLDCDVAVLLNVTPDHLDRYAGFEAYAASKARLFDMQSVGRIALFNADDPVADEWYMNIEQDECFGERWRNARFFTACEEGEPRLDQSSWPALQGPHNAQNAAAAIGVCESLAIDARKIAEGLRTYPGLPHRMERVAEKHGILFVNDSKATNPDSTAPALAAYPYIHWIVGGLAKTHSLGPCEAQLGHVRAAYTIGDSGPMFAQLLDGKVPVTECGVLAKAVETAADAAKAGEVVLLSPACASFDQFRDYEARGQAFRDAVGALS